MTSSDRPSLADPWILIATGLGSGYLPKAPGTWGSALAALLAWPIMGFGGAPALALAAIMVTGLGFKATAVYQERSGRKDPGPVVVDEVSGQWIALLACPLDPLWFLAGFAAFRLFDITKPPPARQIDRNMGGAAGVMLDDVVAGLYAAGAVLAARWALVGL
ncbi:MAG: phosphatidylglycerophosphatase A [Alphaproteobacteria bacterium]|nr:phosphatidylglycerophosphatase A [Alphaproteobacteria bacterium]